MLDKKFLINNQEKYENNMKRRNMISTYETFKNLYENKKKISDKIQKLKEAQNKLNNFSEYAKNLKEELLKLIDNEKQLDKELQQWLSYQPNFLLQDVPDGKDESENLEIYKTNIPVIKSRPHYELIENLILTYEAVELSGSRFVVLKEKLSNLKRALVSFLLDHNQTQGYEIYEVPYIVNSEILYGTGQLPKFSEEAFCLTNGQWLISTGEVPLVNLFRNKIFLESELPKLCTTYSPCFRSEAGSAGRDTKGLIRLHQFHKVELVSICKPEDSEYYHQKQLETAKSVLNKLQLPFRVIIICSGDTGFTASKQYDIEIWLPGSNRFMEIASCSQCGTFQAIRSQIKYKKDKKNEYVHTLNGSSLPLERLIVGIVENYYDEKSNSIKIPQALIPYFKENFIKL